MLEQIIQITKFLLTPFKPLIAKYDCFLKKIGIHNPFNPFDNKCNHETEELKENFTIEYVVEQARNTYEDALKFIEEHKEQIEKLYPNAVFEMTMNIKTRNQDKLTEEEKTQLTKDIEYFLTKPKRYVSDSAILLNYIFGEYGSKNTPLELRERIEKFLLEKKTSYSFMYFMMQYDKKLEEKYNILKEIYTNIDNPAEKEKINIYFDEMKKYNKIKMDNIIVDRLKKV